MQTQFTRVAFGLTALLGSLAVLAQPVEFDGRFYEVIVAEGISWDTANETANTMTFQGVQGHLATITSLEEDQFVESLRQQADLAKPEVWVGGFQEDGAEEPGGGWMWINGEPIAPENTMSPYTNWQNGEPNDLGGEMHLGVGHQNIFGWNDERVLGNIGGFVVEYGDKVDATSCTGMGCSPSGPGNTIIFEPEQPIPPGATVTQEVITLIDPRPAQGKCGKKSLVVFADDPDVPNLKISKNHCAADSEGEFIVLKTEAPSVPFQGFTVDVVNVPELFNLDPALPCNIPIPLGSNPEDQDIALWQPTDKKEVVERRALDVTYFCDSSRGRTRGLSYYVIGMQYNFGIDFDLYPEAVEHKFVVETFKNLVFLKLAIIKARPVLSRSDFRLLLRTAAKATVNFVRGKYGDASAKIEEFLMLVDQLAFEPREFNDRGNLEMRGRAIGFMIDVKVAPFAM